MPETIHVTMLGRFAISCGGHTIDDSSNRMKKVWLLLAYLIYTRNSHTTREHFLSLLQGSKPTDEPDDPTDRLKTLFYRARSLLDQLQPGLGHRLILFSNGAYSWNTQYPLELDVECFDSICTAIPQKDSQARLDQLMEALALYRGDFLPKLSMDPWVMPINAWFHQQYLHITDEALALLEAQALWDKAADLCSAALKLEPYSETLYQHLMRCRLAVGDRTEVLTLYERLSELLFDNFGVIPSDESLKLYREASKFSTDKSVTITALRDQLKENDPARGAMVCEYDFFKMLYQIQARSIIRSGDVIHIALLTLRGPDQQELPRRSLDRAMANLLALATANLRQGDVVTKYNMSQLLIMLPNANYENSCAVCQRITKAFYRQYPRTPAHIHSSVHPLEPLEP